MWKSIQKSPLISPLTLLLALASSSCGSGTEANPIDGGNNIIDASESIELVSIAIEPALAELLSVNGSMPEQQFAVVGTYSDGTTGSVPAPAFTIDVVSMGSIDPDSGQFRANGVIAGNATVSVEIPSATNISPATASLLVKIEKTDIDPAIVGDPAGLFVVPPIDDSVRAAEIVYPLNGVVMPQNVFPPDVQWLRGTEGDVYRIVVRKPSLTVTQYLQHSGVAFGNHWQVDIDAWRSIAQSDPNAVSTITVDRWEAATMEVISSPPIDMTIARAAVSGTVYYWDIQRGRVVQIDDGTNVPIEFMPTPQQGCVGCHSVSSSGRYMAGRLGGGQNVGAVYDLTQDLSVAVPPTVFPITNNFQWWFSSWNPDDTRLVVSDLEGANGTGRMRFFEPTSGVEAAMAGVTPTGISQPAWSPDGNTIAYVSEANNWGGQMTSGNISTVDMSVVDTIGPAQLIHAGSDLNLDVPGGTSDSYPSWTPDSAKIAFGHGNSARSENGRSALYIMNPDGTDVSRLNNAVGGAMADDNFQPRFSPFESGGYYWLSFLSRRNYGNSEVGTNGAGLQQIWVAAVKVGSLPGEDPSFVPYWLPGQRTSSRNISAYWAPRACRDDGDECSVGAQCCSGDCRPDGEGTFVCTPPDPNLCNEVNQSCATDNDCCEGLGCSFNICLPIID